jgi:histidinol phosphatase-like enzyme (inositol monophosphatase family)
MTVDQHQLQKYATVANDLADIARTTAMSFFRTAVSIELKSDTSPVTVADKTTEQLLRQKIALTFPEHTIVGEELETALGAVNNPWRWTFDPIDGTRAFITGVPLFGSLIALQHNEEIVLGIIEMPALKERFVAYKKNVSTTKYISYFISSDNKQQELKTSNISSLEESRLFATDPAMFDAQQKSRFDRLANQCAVTRYGADCYAYALLAIGHNEIVAEADMKPYDYRALIAIVEAAGGVITDWQGNSLAKNTDTSTVLAAANAELHKQALQNLTI